MEKAKKEVLQEKKNFFIVSWFVTEQNNHEVNMDWNGCATKSAVVKKNVILMGFEGKEAKLI